MKSQDAVLKKTLIASARGAFAPIQLVGIFVLSMLFCATPASADTAVLTFDEATRPPGLRCEEVWSEAGFELLVRPSTFLPCMGETCNLFVRPDHIRLVQASMDP